MIQIRESEFDTIRGVVGAAETLVENAKKYVKPEEVETSTISVNRRMFDSLQRALHEFHESKEH